MHRFQVYFENNLFIPKCIKIIVFTQLNVISAIGGNVLDNECMTSDVLQPQTVTVLVLPSHYDKVGL